LTTIKSQSSSLFGSDHVFSFFDYFILFKIKCLTSLFYLIEFKIDRELKKSFCFLTFLDVKRKGKAQRATQGKKEVV